jgi:hypothetical protein
VPASGGSSWKEKRLEEVRDEGDSIRINEWWAWVGD